MGREAFIAKDLLEKVKKGEVKQVTVDYVIAKYSVGMSVAYSAIKALKNLLEAEGIEYREIKGGVSTEKKRGEKEIDYEIIMRKLKAIKKYLDNSDLPAEDKLKRIKELLEDVAID